jgi:CBS domain-containing protein
MIAARRIAVVGPKIIMRRAITSVSSELEHTARDAVKHSRFGNIDFKIAENLPVYDAVKRMAANRIGALAVTSSVDNTIIGIVTERDYLNKIALLGKESKSTPVSEICIKADVNLVSVQMDEPVTDCMKKMLQRDTRHLLVKDSAGKIVNIFSIKDLCKCMVEKQKEEIQRLATFSGIIAH